MASNDQIKDEKLQYRINRETSKISAQLSGKTNRYEFLSCKKIIIFESKANNKKN